MTDASGLGPLGVWAPTDGMGSGAAADFAGRVEGLGYSTLWLPEVVGRDPFAHIAFLASATERLGFATGIASIHHRHPGAMKQAANTIAEQTGGRFVLGIGVSHAPFVEGVRGVSYSKPLTTMRRYLQAMDASPYMAAGPASPPPRLLAALGPKMLALSAEMADGAHPYWTTPEHTAQAREILGPDKLLCAEQKVVLTTDPTEARTTASSALSIYADLPNYRNNWLRLGYTEEQINARDEGFIDALVAWGDADTIRRRIDEHLSAGANHVCIQALSPANPFLPDERALAALAPAPSK
ncbi:MAG: TIGR03620 family F420-dependent LLM class oxidoreductase [Actinomycetota bacterium]